MMQDQSNSQTCPNEKRQNEKQALNSAKTVYPYCIEKTFHLRSLVFSVIQMKLIIYIGTNLCATTQEMQERFSTCTVAIGYMFICLSICATCDHIFFTKNMGKFNQMQKDYKSVKEQPVNLVFTIESYHLEKQIKNNSLKKVITNEAKKIFQIKSIHKDSEHRVPFLEQILTISKPVIYIQYEDPEYSLTDQESNNLMYDQYNKFVQQNIKDQQHYDNNFWKCPYFKKYFSYSSLSIGSGLFVINLVLCVLGLGWPFCIFLQGFVSRYGIKMAKNIQLTPDQFVKKS